MVNAIKGKQYFARTKKYMSTELLLYFIIESFLKTAKQKNALGIIFDQSLYIIYKCAHRWMIDSVHNNIIIIK